MKLFALLAPTLLAALAFANEDASASPASPAAAEEPSKAPVEPTPVGELWTSSWTDLDVKSYTKHCAATSTFRAEVFKLSELYPKLKDVAPQLKVFYNKQLYPGSWKGIDLHGAERELLKMNVADMPYAVREWLGKNQKQRHFWKEEDVCFFAPGAIYPLLPLWAEDAEGEACEAVLQNLDHYSNELKDDAVVGRLSHQAKGENKVEFTVEAFQVKAKASEKAEL